MGALVGDDALDVIMWRMMGKSLQTSTGSDLFFLTFSDNYLMQKYLACSQELQCRFLSKNWPNDCCLVYIRSQTPIMRLTHILLSSITFFSLFAISGCLTLEDPQLPFELTQAPSFIYDDDTTVVIRGNSFGTDFNSITVTAVRESDSTIISTLSVLSVNENEIVLNDANLPSEVLFRFAVTKGSETVFSKLSFSSNDYGRADAEGCAVVSDVAVGTFTGTDFSATSANGIYIDNQRYCWNFTSTSGGSVRVTFPAATFQTEACCDFALVYDTNGDLIGLVKGNLAANAIFTSTGSTLTVKLITNDSNTSSFTGNYLRL